MDNKMMSFISNEIIDDKIVSITIKKIYFIYNMVEDII